MRRLSATLLLLGSAGLAGHGMAAEWTFSPRAAEELFYDDNVAFTVDDTQASPGSTTTVGGRLVGRSRDFEVSLDGRLDFMRYLSESELDTDNQFLNFDMRQISSRGQLALSGSLARDVSREDEITSTGSRQFNNERQETYNLQPSFSWQLTPTQTANIAAGIRRRAYPEVRGAAGDGLFSGTQSLLGNQPSTVEQDPIGPLQNFTEYSLDLSWTEALTSRLAAGAGFSGLISDQARQNLGLVSVQGVLRWQILPRLDVDLRAGPSLSRIDTRVQEVSDLELEALPGGGFDIVRRFSKGEDSEVKLGYVVNSSISWATTPRTTTRFAYSRSTSPSGTQGVVTRDDVSLDVTHRALRRLRLFAAGGAFRQENVSDGGAERTGLRLEPGVTWQAFEDLDLSLRYRLRYEEFGSSSNAATSNAVLLRVDLRLPEARTFW